MSEGLGKHFSGIIEGVVATIVCNLIGVVCFALGLAEKPDLNDPKNWPVWVTGLFAFGFLGIGAGIFNAIRVWWKRRRIGPGTGQRLTIILADLENDDSNRQKNNVRDALLHYLGENSIQIITYPQVLAIGEGQYDAEVLKTQARAQKVLKGKRGDLLIWGRVKSAGVLALYFTALSGKTSMVSSYALDATLELPAKFDNDLGAAVAARVLALGTALINRQGNFLTPYAEHFATQIKPLVAISKPGWSADARGAVLYAFGLAKTLAGEEHGNTEALKEAIDVLGAALKEYPRTNAPLRWAGIQNTLGNALRALGEREPDTAQLEEAVTTYRAALSAYTAVPLLSAATQNNLGNALQLIGARQNNTARIKEAIDAHHEALKVLSLKQSARDFAATQNSLGNALLLIAEHETGTTRLKEAVTAYDEALKVYDRTTLPLFWAGIQLNRATALRMIGEREPGKARLKNAIAGYREALTVYSREHNPLDWAMSIGNQAIAMMLLADRNGDLAMAEKAVASMAAACKTFQDTGHQAFAKEMQTKLPLAQALVKRLGTT